MGDLSYWEQSLHYRENTFSEHSTESHISFIFSCKPVFLHSHQNSTNSPYERLFNRPPIDNMLSFSLEDFVSKERPQQIVEEILKEWPVHENLLKPFIEDVIKKARDEIKKMPSDDNAVTLEFSVFVKHQHFDNEDHVLYLTIQQSIEEDCCMVPAAESSIESLEKRFIDNGTCSICLEDFNSCEGACMPSCPHIFHPDCIKKWLRTSHYCPNCRSEMPTH